ncbi:MAG TPA: hypothetical protein VFG10_09380 [Saprospiraceae bacterium]|nr:hypothetical protein [Saprospiraceae bacterium]
MNLNISELSTHLSQFYLMVTGVPCSIKFTFENNTADWLFDPRDGGKHIVFNTTIESRCRGQYYLSIIIHEFYHFIHQGIPFKKDVDELKEVLGNNFMISLDMQADYYTAVYFNKNLGFDLQDFIGLLYDGSSTFASSEFSKNKFCRYIGTILTVGYYFIYKINRTYLTGYIEGSETCKFLFFVTDFKQENFKRVQSIIDNTSFESLKLAFSSSETLGRSEYISIIRSFVEDQSSKLVET